MKNGQRVIGITLLGMIILAGCMLASVAYGSNLIPIGQVLQALQNPDSGTFEASVVWARIPRTVFGVLAGAALGVSGVLMQAVTRNPIADPSVLGVNTGASLFVVIGIAWMHITSSQQYIWLAFAGAALTAVFVYGIASVGYGGPTSIKLALAGTATGTALSALVNTIMLPDSSVMKEFRFWQVGSISGTSWGEIRTILPYLLVGFVLAVILIPALNALALGDELAAGLGVNVQLVRALAALGGVLLCAATTALAGPIGFVGLMVPHFVRLTLGADLKTVIPLSALYGAALLVLADVLGRVLGSPGELEVGIVTAVLGAPVFILVAKKAKVRSL